MADSPTLRDQTPSEGSGGACRFDRFTIVGDADPGIPQPNEQKTHLLVDGFLGACRTVGRLRPSFFG
jgi:hypothetical protein